MTNHRLAINKVGADIMIYYKMQCYVNTYIWYIDRIQVLHQLHIDWHNRLAMMGLVLVIMVYLQKIECLFECRRNVLPGHDGQHRFGRRTGCEHFGLGHDMSAHNCSPLWQMHCRQPSNHISPLEYENEPD